MLDIELTDTQSLKAECLREKLNEIKLICCVPEVA